MWVAFAFAKTTHIFFSKNTCELDIVLTRTVNILTTNELVKLTMLWTTGPWILTAPDDFFVKYICIFLLEIDTDIPCELSPSMKCRAPVYRKNKREVSKRNGRKK